ncbi:MAG: hypothetical protein IPJ65_43300 [Archangiaceae bacterium]|nr:hypothetical protein [Archangiaceae bacterium]
MTTRLTVEAPELTPIWRNLGVASSGGIVNQPGNEAITAAPGDAFSFCQPSTIDLDAGTIDPRNYVVFRVSTAPDAARSSLPQVQAFPPAALRTPGCSGTFRFSTRPRVPDHAGGGDDGVQRERCRSGSDR